LRGKGDGSLLQHSRAITKLIRDDGLPLQNRLPARNFMPKRGRLLVELLSHVA
jgi:hypothetical protein